MTKAYVWEYASGITASWHDGGGVLIVTDRDPAEAWEEVYRKDRLDIDALTDVPDFEYDLAGDYPERVVVFPDAGCC